MNIILHRANTLSQLIYAQNNDWGVEVDVRTHCGIAYLSHDPIVQLEQNTLSVAHLWEWMLAFSGTLLLDFKETGIARNCVPIPNMSYHCDWTTILSRVFGIDLIVPDQLALHDRLQTLSRRSQYENITTDGEAGFWIDYVTDVSELKSHKSIANFSYVVSPEIHKHKLSPKFIQTVIDMGFAGVCTDVPKQYAALL